MSTNSSSAPQAHFISDYKIDDTIDGIASGFVRVEHGALTQKRELAAQIEALLSGRPDDESSPAFTVYTEKFTYTRETFEARYARHFAELYKTEPGDNAASMAWSRLLSYTTVKPISKAGRPRATAPASTDATATATSSKVTKPKATAGKDAADIIRAYVSALVTKKGKDQARQQIDAAQLIAVAGQWDTAVRAAQGAAAEAERKASEQAKREAEEAEAARIEAIVQARIAELQRSNRRK